VTQIEELQESLRKSETMSAMGTLVAGVAHEVRNPLFSISATLDAFEARFGLRTEYQEHVRILRQELDRLNGLMRDLLDYGKPASLNLTENGIETIITEAISACSTLASKAQVEISRLVAPELPKVRCDNRRLAEVFRNLLENAIQHSPKGGRVSIELQTVREDHEIWIQCAVRDNGSGFRPEDIPHLFEPFFTRRRGGTGLGLAIVERIVEQHGGKTLARNRAEGGAEVLVRLRARESRED
jgi:signal transduction histidine kinase